MNQKNGKNSLGLDKCFEEANNPIELFKKWFAKAEETEINDPGTILQRFLGSRSPSGLLFSSNG